MAEQTHNGGFLFNFPIYSHPCHRAVGVSTAKPIPFSFPPDSQGKAKSPGLSPTAWSQPNCGRLQETLHMAIVQNYYYSSLLSSCTSTSHKACMEVKGLISIVNGFTAGSVLPKTSLSPSFSQITSCFSQLPVHKPALRAHGGRSLLASD